MNLSDDGVKDFLTSLDSGSIAVIRAMMATEDWVLDNEPEVQEHINALGERLNKLPEKELRKLSASKFLEVMGSMNTARTMCLLANLEQKGEMGAWLVGYAASSNDESSDLLMSRLATMSKIRIMSHVFSEVNVGFVKDALELMN